LEKTTYINFQAYINGIIKIAPLRELPFEKKRISRYMEYIFNTSFEVIIGLEADKKLRWPCPFLKGNWLNFSTSKAAPLENVDALTWIASLWEWKAVLNLFWLSPE